MLLKPTRDLKALRGFLHDHLIRSVLPFWLEHAIDEEGGINTCIRDDGTLISRDKWMWSQWRAVWVFSKLYNVIERNKQWLEIAAHIYQFASRFGWDDKVGGWCFRLSSDGKIIEGCTSIYTDAFAIYGTTELARASGWGEPVSLAHKTAENVLQRLKSPHDRIPVRPYTVPPGARAHGIPMVFSLTLWELGQFLGEKRYQDAALAMSDDIFEHFYRHDRDLILEYVASDNSEYPLPLGTVVVPGHAIEDMWFQIHIARDMSNRERIAQATRLIRRNVQMGWDEEYGGLLLAVDADGREEVGWKFHSSKLWWPHTEAMYALLLAYEYTQDPWYLQWYDKVHEYSFSHYFLPAYGEWMQRLDRLGRPMSETVALPVKDPFHLPRALVGCLDVLDRLLARAKEISACDS